MPKGIKPAMYPEYRPKYYWNWGYTDVKFWAYWPLFPGKMPVGPAKKSSEFVILFLDQCIGSYTL